MWLVNKYSVYLKICFNIIGDVRLRGISGRSVLMDLMRAALPGPDLLEIAGDSDVSIVVKHEM